MLSNIVKNSNQTGTMKWPLCLGKMKTVDAWEEHFLLGWEDQMSFRREWELKTVEDFNRVFSEG